MTRTTRSLAVALVALLTVAVAAPSLAGGSDHGGVADDTTVTTVVAVPISAGDEPAVVVPSPEADVIEHPWTTRYLIPLLVVTALALIIGIAIAYNRSIRRRYKVVA